MRGDGCGRKSCWVAGLLPVQSGFMSLVRPFPCRFTIVVLRAKYTSYFCGFNCSRDYFIYQKFLRCRRQDMIALTSRLPVLLTRGCLACVARQGLWRSTQPHNTSERFLIPFPDMMPAAKDDRSTDEQRKARVLIEKKTVINLIEAFGVAVKHYLRGEEGVYYVDLYHLVKYLPAYALPAGMPSLVDVNSTDGSSTQSPPLRARGDSAASVPEMEGSAHPSSPRSASFQHGQLPFPATSPTAAPTRKVSVQADLPMPPRMSGRSRTFDEKRYSSDKASTHSRVTEHEDFLLPARNPPKYHLLDLFPLSLLVGYLTKKGKEVKGKKAARIRAKLRSKVVTHNLPLEISLYLVSVTLPLTLVKSLTQ